MSKFEKIAELIKEIRRNYTMYDFLLERFKHEPLELTQEEYDDLYGQYEDYITEKAVEIYERREK